MTCLSYVVDFCSNGSNSSYLPPLWPMGWTMWLTLSNGTMITMTPKKTWEVLEEQGLSSSLLLRSLHLTPCGLAQTSLLKTQPPSSPLSQLTASIKLAPVARHDWSHPEPTNLPTPRNSADDWSHMNESRRDQQNCQAERSLHGWPTES